MSEDKKKVVFPQFELASCPTFDLKAAMEYLETGDDAVFETAVDTVTGKKLSKGFVLAMLPLARKIYRDQERNRADQESKAADLREKE
jgi:hypothetical protein